MTQLFKVGISVEAVELGYIYPDKPMEIVVEQIPQGCQIQFWRMFSDDELKRVAQTCEQKGSISSQRRHEMLYRICDCVPMLDSQVQSMYIDQEGYYMAVISGATGLTPCLGEVSAYAYPREKMAGKLTDAMRGCCGARKTDLQAFKTTPLPRYKIGEVFSYTVRVLNVGPSDASGATVKDVLPVEFEASSVSIVYGNGANGTPTLTTSQLASFQVGAFPPSGYADITVTGKYTKHGAYLNRVSITTPEGVEETNPSNNTAEVLVNIDEEPIVFPPDPVYIKCGGTPLTSTDEVITKNDLTVCLNGVEQPYTCGMTLKAVDDCCETNTWATQDSQFSGGGVCQIATATSWENGVAIVAMRDFSNVKGSVVFYGSNPPTHFPFTYTNNTGCPVLVEARLTGYPNGSADLYNYELGSIFSITDTLNVTPPSSFSVPSGNPNFMWHSYEVLGATSTGTGANLRNYQTSTVSGARYRAIVPDGGTLNLFAQAWLVLFEDSAPAGSIVMHTDMQLDITITKGAAYL